jgi:membrane associated rhomboid family serine protease
MFMHASWFHLGSNLLYLWIFGNNIEEALGHFRFLVFYLFCGVVAAGLQVFMSLGSPVPVLGASGAIAGVLGAYYVRFPTARILTLVWFFITYIPASVVLFLWFLLQLVQSVGALGSRAQGGVAVFAHVGGFVAGWFLLRLFPGPRREQRYWR